MSRYHFHLWYACRSDPFMAARQCIEITANTEEDAELALISQEIPAISPPIGIHDGCCYIQEHEFVGTFR